MNEKCQIGQNVVNWVKKLETVKMLKFECKWDLIETIGINENVQIWVQNVKSIKLLKFDGKFRNQSKYSNSGAKCPIDQNVTIWWKL